MPGFTSTSASPVRQRPRARTWTLPAATPSGRSSGPPGAKCSFGRTALWIGGYGTFAATILCAGLALGWRSLPAGAFRPVARKRRPAGAKRRQVGEVRERAD